MDLAILSAVARDARATLAQLSAEVGRSPSAVQARLKRLEASGVIAGYRPILDAEALRRPLSAFVAITPLDPGQPDTAPEQLEHLDAIEACFRSRATPPTGCSRGWHRPVRSRTWSATSAGPPP